MIPKILHQVWLGGRDFPDIFYHWHQNWKRLHPDWAYKFWKEEDIAEIQHIVERATAYSSRSNVVRIWAVLKYGGIYADMDFDWNKSLNPLLDNEAFASKENSRIYCNAIFGAEANHEWVKWMFDNVEGYVDRRPPWGPKLMTRGIRVMGKNVTKIPSSYFYPYSWNRRYQDARNFPDSYAVHHWHKSWAQKPGGVDESAG